MGVRDITLHALLSAKASMGGLAIARKARCSRKPASRMSACARRSNEAFRQLCSH